MNRTTCFLVDDERLARQSLKALLKAHPELEVVGEAATLPQAEEGVRRHTPDLLFLDIQLPEGTGFDLLKRLEQPPRVIFVTAYDRYAVRAFEVNAVDYLLKPVEPERLARAVGRVLSGSFPKLPSASLAQEDAVLVPAGRSGYFVHVADLLAIAAEGNYTILQTLDGTSHIQCGTLGEWERRLPPSFLRVGRSLILNLRHIRKVEPTGRHTVVETGPGGQRFTLKRVAASRLKEVLTRFAQVG